MDNAPSEVIATTLIALVVVLAHHEPQNLTGLIVATAIVIGTNMWVQVYHLNRVIRWQQEAPAH